MSAQDVIFASNCHDAPLVRRDPRPGLVEWFCETCGRVCAWQAFDVPVTAAELFTRHRRP